MASAQNHYYESIKVVSPMYDGQDKKDQDRAAWFPAALSGCVCDGVTTSPFSDKGAGIVTKFSPVIFSNNINHSLKTICDLLMILREEKVHSDIAIPSDISKPMQKMVREVALQNMKNSFQTTMVAAKIAPTSQTVTVSVVRCGDSMFLAFASDGEVLITSPAYDEIFKAKEKQHCKDKVSVETYSKISFGNSDELLAKVLCCCADRPELAADLGIKEAHLHNWLVCAAIDKWNGHIRDAVSDGRIATELKHGDLLLVPRHLAAPVIDSKFHRYVRVLYSRMVKIIKSANNPVKKSDFHRSGSTTAVLPDHFYTGDWTFFEERFPLNAQYVLSSDGFYSCFKDPESLWSWLNGHKQHLQDPQKQVQIIEDLHKHLQKERSDDDISFVWIYPAKAFCEEE